MIWKNTLCMENVAESQINYLLNNNLIERISNKQLKVKGKGKIYNPSKPVEYLQRL